MNESRKWHSEAIEIPSIGKYRLFRDQGLTELINNGDFLTLINSSIPKPMTMSFLLKYYRFIIMGWSQNKLARLTRITPNQISNIEKEKTKPQKKTIKKLGKVLGTDFEKLALHVCDSSKCS